MLDTLKDLQVIWPLEAGTLSKQAFFKDATSKIPDVQPKNRLAVTDTRPYRFIQHCPVYCLGPYRQGETFGLCYIRTAVKKPDASLVRVTSTERT
jgi:hypothetical protein